MSIAEDGSAIICGELVRKGSVKILRILARQTKPISVPELGDLFKEPCADADLYTVLRRLARKSTLVIRTAKQVDSTGVSLRRVTWEATEAVKQFFLKHEPNS